MVRSIAVAALTLVLTAPAAATAATFLADPSIPDSSTATCAAGDACSLRRAIVAADASDGNTVQVEAGVHAITGVQISTSRAITIVGAGAASTIVDGAGSTTRFLNIGILSGATMRLSALTVRNFRTGISALAVNDYSGTVELSHLVFERNEAATGAAIRYVADTGGRLRISATSFVRNGATTTTGGGAVRYEASSAGTGLTIEDSTFGENTSGGPGGAVSLLVTKFQTSVSITNTTFAGNTAATAGGALSIEDGAPAGGAALTLRSATFTLNTAPAGAALAAPATTSGSMAGTVLAGGGSLCALAAGSSFASAGANLSEDASCALTGPGDRQSLAAGLQPLGDFGGPTPTAPPALGSPLVNAAASCPATDQRGVARPQGSACDIGAVEVRPAVLQGQPTVTGTPSAGNTLTCALPPIDSPDGTPTTAVTWTRDGTAVASSSTYLLTADDAGRAISCLVSVTAAGGSTSAASPTVAVAALPTPLPPAPGTPGTPGTPQPPAGRAPAPALKLSARKRSLGVISASKGFLLAVRCDVACAVAATAKLDGKSVGSGRQTIRAAKATLVRVKLTSAGLRRLTGRRTATFTVRVTARAAPGGAQTVRTLKVVARRA